jgi:hypothetical protein
MLSHVILQETRREPTAMALLERPECFGGAIGWACCETSFT